MSIRTSIYTVGNWVNRALNPLSITPGKYRLRAIVSEKINGREVEELSFFYMDQRSSFFSARNRLCVTIKEKGSEEKEVHVINGLWTLTTIEVFCNQNFRVDANTGMWSTLDVKQDQIGLISEEAYFKSSILSASWSGSLILLGLLTAMPFWGSAVFLTLGGIKASQAIFRYAYAIKGVFSIPLDT